MMGRDGNYGARLFQGVDTGTHFIGGSCHHFGQGTLVKNSQWKEAREGVGCVSRPLSPLLEGT
jgi:hypothetical protein